MTSNVKSIFVPPDHVAVTLNYYIKLLTSQLIGGHLLSPGRCLTYWRPETLGLVMLPGAGECYGSLVIINFYFQEYLFKNKNQTK